MPVHYKTVIIYLHIKVQNILINGRNISFAAKFEEPERGKRGIIRILFKAIIDITLEAFLAFIRQRKNKALYKAFFAMRRQQHFQVNQLEYLEEVMTPYGTYSADSIREILDAINFYIKT